MANIYLKGYEWAKSKSRSIDDSTLCDLLGMTEYQAKRSELLEQAGIEDKAAPEEALYTYVLDALGVPPEGEKQHFKGEHEAFSKECSFSREWFEELFYSEYLLDNERHNWSYQDILHLIRSEVANGLKRHYR